MSESSKNKRSLGTAYEDKAARYLEEYGVRIVERSFRGRFGEIDLIGYDGDTLVFFEVKYRSSSKSGFAEEAVTPSKRSTICKVADYYRVMHGISDFADLRFDVIAINEDKIHWIQNAFNYC